MVHLLTYQPMIKKWQHQKSTELLHYVHLTFLTFNIKRSWMHFKSSSDEKTEQKNVIILQEFSDAVVSLCSLLPLLNCSSVLVTYKHHQTFVQQMSLSWSSLSHVDTDTKEGLMMVREVLDSWECMYNRGINILSGSVSHTENLKICRYVVCLDVNTSCEPY